jgi:hypothetical protein
VKARRSHIFPKATDGHYVEPAWCSERLFAIEPFGAPGALVLDPAAGWGNIPRAAIAAGYTAVASDIADRLDHRGLEGIRFHICNFLEESPVRSAWSVACNPPFDRVREFCERGLEIATYKVAMIVPLRRLPAARWLESLPLESVYLLTPRPSMPPGAWIAAGNIPGGGSQDFCWLVFNKRAGSTAPRLRWLPRLNGARRENRGGRRDFPPVTSHRHAGNAACPAVSPTSSGGQWSMAMALGKRKDSANFLPLCKYDARTGTFYLQDRTQVDGNWQTAQRDVTDTFRAVFDLEHLQRGWIRFPQGADPEVKLVPAGEDPGEAPADDWKEGLRLLIKMSPQLGGDIRELMSTARALWAGIDTLHDEYLAAAADHPGELPEVVLSEARQTKSGSSTNYLPVFEIADWVQRPSDLSAPLPRSARVTRQAELDLGELEPPPF